jgi:DNA-directed RNA polymerase specialized sigma24 family protein
MSLGQDLAPHLPFLRRYARALTGSQAHGDAFVRATLEAIVASPEDFPKDVDPRLGLYRTFHAIWSSANIEEGDEPDDGYNNAEGIARARLSRITPLSRQALLLTSLEGFSTDDTAYLIGSSPSDVDGLVGEAMAEIERQTLADVLIIEDEPPRPRSQRHRRCRHARRGDRPGPRASPRPGPRRHPAGGRFVGHRRGQGHPRRILGAGDLHHRLPRAVAHGNASGADLSHHQAVPAGDGQGGDQPGAVLRRGDRSGGVNRG